MTTLAITPNWKNKSAKFKGTVAAGEHVSVTILNDDGEGGEFIADASTLRLRVVNPCNGRTLAIFPEPVPEGETPETWDSDLSPLRCTLNLNTVQMLKAVPPAANVPLLWVLDDYDNNTLYFKEQFPVEHWPRLRGEEEPTDLDNYKDIIADFNTRLDGYDTRITGAENAAQAATVNASAAAAKANQAVGIANQAVDKAETAQNSAAASAVAAHNSALAAEEAQEAAESAAESINSPDATLTEEGVAADAKAAGEAIAAEKERAETAEAAEETRAKGIESGLRTDLTAAQEAIDDEAVLRAAADADLEANKADKATTYTKTEVDTKIAGVQTFKKYLVQTLPDPDEADMKGLYLVPTGETTEEGDLCEEWTVVEENGEKRWEKIGAKAVDLTLDDTVTSSSANGVKSSGIWSALWGTASTAFTSLYDWAVAQLGLKRDYTDLSYDTTETVEVPALHVTMRNILSWQVIAEYDFLCTEEVPNPPQMGHVYTWRADGAEFYITQGVSALQTTWILYSQNGEVIEDITTQNATQGFYPDVDFIANAAVITTHKTTVQKQVAKEDTIALESKTVPASRTINGKALSSDVTLTGADIAVSGTDPTKIDAALANKATKADVDPLLFAQYYPDGSVKSAAEFTPGIKYGSFDDVHRTVSVLPFCNTGNSENDNSSLSGRVVIPPFVDAQGNPYISDDGTRYKVVGMKIGTEGNSNTNLTAIVAPNTVTDIEGWVFGHCTALITISIPAATSIGEGAFAYCTSLTSVSLPVVTTIGNGAFAECSKLTTVSFPVAASIGGYAFVSCILLTSVDFGDTPRDSVPSLGEYAFASVPSACKIIVPDAQYDAWTSASGWSALYANGYKFLKHSEWEYARKYELDGKQNALSAQQLANIAAVPNKAEASDLRYTLPSTITMISSASSEDVEGETINYGAATLADRTANVVQVTTPLDELRITFPAATSGKVRDFGLRVEIGTGSAALAAPALVPIAPTGETIKIENNAAEIPALADGTATAKGVTLLYFSETAPGVFVVKGEQVEEVA